MKYRKTFLRIILFIWVLSISALTSFYSTYALEESQIQESVVKESKIEELGMYLETDIIESEDVHEKKQLSLDAIEEVLGKEYWILSEEQIGELDDAGYDVSGFYKEPENPNAGIMLLSDPEDYNAIKLESQGNLSWSTSTDDKIYTYGGNSYWRNGSYVTAYQTHKYVTYNGIKQDIYCLQPYTGAPSQGSHDVYRIDHDHLLKVLYYGYGGPGYSSEIANIYSRVDPYYSAFASGTDAAYYLLTHSLAALAYEDSDWAYGLSQNAADTVMELYQYIKTLPSPNEMISISFSQPHGTYTFVNSEGDYESPTIYVEGKSTDYILFTVPSGMTLRDVSGKRYESGESIKLYGGMQFCLTAPNENVNGTYMVTCKGNVERYQSAVIFDIQDLAFLDKYFDEGDETVLQVDWPEDNGSIEIYKASSIPDITDGNECYTLEGATYAVYNSEGIEVGKVTTNESGYGKLDNLPNGTYTIREVVSPPGYIIDINNYTVILEQGEAESVYLKDTPENAPSIVLAQKVNAETGVSENERVEGAEFEVKYYDVISDSDPAVNGHAPLRTWILKTDSKGYIKMDHAYKVSGDAFYMNDTMPTLPEGTITIQEIKAPAGYLVNDMLYIRKIEVEASENKVHYNMPIIEEKPHYVKITLTKTIHTDDINFDNGNPMFMFKVSGKDVRGDERTCYKIVDFTEDFVKSNTDESGNVSMTVVFDKLIAGHYVATELDTGRYCLEVITNVKNGIANQDSVTFNMTSVNITEGSATFINDNYEQQNYSDTQKVINELKSD